WLSSTDEVLLADNVVKRLWPKPRCQRRLGAEALCGGGAEKV
ncbi:MAG: hypothetical protein RLY45_1683, partial [Actinomycetota bacterium]